MIAGQHRRALAVALDHLHIDRHLLRLLHPQQLHHRGVGLVMPSAVAQHIPRPLGRTLKLADLYVCVCCHKLFEDAAVDVAVYVFELAVTLRFLSEIEGI